MHILPFLLSLHSVLPSPLSLPQGYFSPNSPCELICTNVCDNEVCLPGCIKQFCMLDDETGLTWMYWTLVLGVLLVLATAVKLALEKMTVGRRMVVVEETGTARYYRSL